MTTMQRSLEEEDTKAWTRLLAKKNRQTSYLGRHTKELI
jgi:hypothetical protein